MKKYLIPGLITLCAFWTSCSNLKVSEWVSTTEAAAWTLNETVRPEDGTEGADVTILTDKAQQKIVGFGTSFSDLSWISLNKLNEADREAILKELFEPQTGASFSICRTPVGANDFSSGWYSYNETDGDFLMENFSIAHDLETLVPFIKNVLRYNKELKIWASPWSPPTWMKYNKHYAASSSAEFRKSVEMMLNQNPDYQGVDLPDYFKKMFDPAYQNDLPAERQGKEGTDMFIQKDEYLKAYALYFRKFIEAYRDQGINVFMVMPQNEFNSAQVFPSCTWTAGGLAEFIGSYLGPAMTEIGVEVFFGTMERPDPSLADTVLTDPECAKLVNGVGFQWAGKDALPVIYSKYPELALFQTEQECGNGMNDWKGAMHSWSLMKHYLGNGVSVYEYWNTSLLTDGVSRWGWPQNSLIVVDADSRQYRFTPEYYLMKHVSHFVKPGAFKLGTDGEYNDLLAFRNPDNSIIIVAANQEPADKVVSFKVDEQVFSAGLKANSINTLKIVR